MTRYGMQENEMQRLAGLMADAIKGQKVGDAVQTLRTDFPELHYV
jgi:glycine/serine hydroxymethyltransferase